MGTFISLLGASLLTVSLNASAGRVDSLLNACKETGKRALQTYAATPSHRQGPANSLERRAFSKNTRKDPFSAFVESTQDPVLLHVGALTSDDPKKSRAMLQKAAQLGYGDAQRDLGFMYSKGENGFPLDLKKAFRWTQEAAEKGDPRAQCSLALMFFGGQGTDKDTTQASTWLESSSRQGFGLAKMALERMKQSIQTAHI